MNSTGAEPDTRIAIDAEDARHILSALRRTASNWDNWDQAVKLDSTQTAAARALARALGADPASVTPGDHALEFPHSFKPGLALDGYRQMTEVTEGRFTYERPETDDELFARLGGNPGEVCLDDDERVAREAQDSRPGPWAIRSGSSGAPEVYSPGRDAERGGDSNVFPDAWHREAATHAVRWDPARVLAEVEAKRRILDLSDFNAQFPDYAGGYDSACEDVIQLLAQPYAGRDGWDERWRLDVARSGCNTPCQRIQSAQTRLRPRPTAGPSSYPGDIGSGVEMPGRAMRVCPRPGCPELTTGGPCPTHRAEHERQRGTRQQRGYDAAYDRARRRWAPKVAACTVHCHAPVCIEPMRLILPTQAWDLGHDEQRNIRGPEHATCNRSAGGKAAHAE